MSVSSTATNCGNNCNPFQSSASLKSINGKYYLDFTFKNKKIIGGGDGGGNISCPGGGNLADSLANNLPSASQECRDSLASQLSNDLCQILGNPWFGTNCYQCSDIAVIMAGSCDSCGNFNGSIGLDITSTKQRCQEVDCA